MISLNRLRLYRKLRKLLGRPLKAGGNSGFPQGYFLLADVVEGRMILKLIRDEGWRLKVIQVFTPETTIEEITTWAKIELN